MGKTPKTAKNIISFEGIHGVGKTTTFHLLKKSMTNKNTKFYSERLQDKPLWPFGSQDKQIAFRSEIHFIQQMIKRDKIIKEDINNRDKKKRVNTCILDRSAISVMVYSKALDLNEKDFQVLDDLYHSVNWSENILIYFYAKPETILSRIKQRGLLDPQRLKWNEDDIRYIETLEKYYKSYLYKLRTKMQIIEIDTDGLTIDDVLLTVKEKLDELIPKAQLPPNQLQLDIFAK